MPTIRQSAQVKKRLSTLLLISGFVITVALIEIFSPNKSELSFVYFAPVLIGSFGMFITRLTIKCSACGGNLAPTVCESGNPFTIPKKIKFCPCCGISIDTEISHAKSHSSAHAR